jgi:hypothetical protein
MSMAESAREAADEIADKRIATLEKAGATFKKIATELCAIAFSSIDDYMSVAEGGEISAIPFDKIKKRKLKAVESVEENTKITESDDGSRIFKDSKIKYKLYNKMDALKYLCKLRGDEPNEKIDMNITGNLSDRLRDARERTKKRS